MCSSGAAPPRITSAHRGPPCPQLPPPVGQHPRREGTSRDGPGSARPQGSSLCVFLCFLLALLLSSLSPSLTFFFSPAFLVVLLFLLPSRDLFLVPVLVVWFPFCIYRCYRGNWLCFGVCCCWALRGLQSRLRLARTRTLHPAAAATPRATPTPARNLLQTVAVGFRGRTPAPFAGSDPGCYSFVCFPMQKQKRKNKKK